MGQEIDRMVDGGICGKYKVRLNQVVDVAEYLLPKPEDLFSTLAGGKLFLSLTFCRHIFNFCWMIHLNST